MSTITEPRTPATRPRGDVAPEDDRSPARELERILAEGLVVAVFQPIVTIDSEQIVGYEALARGPEGSPLQRPDRLFAAARAAGRVAELDWLCRARAVQSALDGGMGRASSLFLNCEPSAISVPPPARHAALWTRALRELNLVLEITERAVCDHPAQLYTQVCGHRAHGCGIALDDLGADTRSLALLPIIEPDVIKLDLRLVQQQPSLEQAAIVAAVAAESERTGAAVLAEGVETEEHARVARALGATLGQGYLWGRPGPLGAPVPSPWTRPLLSRSASTGRTPFDVVASHNRTAIASKRQLLSMSHLLERRTLAIGEEAILLSAFQDARHFTPATARRYETLADRASLVAAFGIDLDDEPAPGVRGARIAGDDPLAGEWSVVVLGPHFSGALVAEDLGDRCDEGDRRFRFTTTYRRDLVIAAARTLVARIAPTAPGGGADPAAA